MATSAQRLTEFEQAQKRYQDLIGGQSSFKTLVEQKLGEKTNYNKDLITQQQNLQERQLSTPSALRAEFATGPIRNPLTQEALIQNRQSNVGSQLGAVNALLFARGQDQTKIQENAGNFFGDILQGAGVDSQMRYNLYKDALEEEASKRAAKAYWDSLTDTTTDDTTTDEPVLDITVDETPKTNWTNLVTKDTGKVIQNNPVTTLAGLVGNLIGNKNNKNLTLWQKLINKRS